MQPVFQSAQTNVGLGFSALEKKASPAITKTQQITRFTSAHPPQSSSDKLNIARFTPQT